MAPSQDKDLATSTSSKSGLQRAGKLSFGSLPLIRGPSNKIGDGSSNNVVKGPKGIVRSGNLKVEWYKEALIRGTSSAVRVPELPGNSQWQLTNDAVEELKSRPPGGSGWSGWLFGCDDDPIAAKASSPTAAAAATRAAASSAAAGSASSTGAASSTAAAVPPAGAAAPPAAAFSTAVALDSRSACRYGAACRDKRDADHCARFSHPEAAPFLGGGGGENPRRPDELRPRPDAVPSQPPNGDGVPPAILVESGGFFGGGGGIFAGGGGSREKDYEWVRHNNQEDARSLRRHISSMTRQATNAGAYIKKGSKIQLRRVEAMMDGTKAVAFSLDNCKMPTETGKFPRMKVTRSKAFAVEAAILAHKEHRNAVAVVSAASSYHCGGAFLTGGRHALEEAMCTQTTLFPSISMAEEQVHSQIQGEVNPWDYVAYIPEDGVILSPQVEIFRGGSDRGYPFMDEPVPLAALISLGMYNKNSSMSDAPMDAPDGVKEYREGAKQKFRSALCAALEVNAIAVVFPDVGCGVYGNDAEEVGVCLGEVLREEFWQHFKEIILVGKSDFQFGVTNTIEDIEATLNPKRASPKPSPKPSPTPSPRPSLTGAGGGGGGGMGAWVSPRPSGASPAAASSPAPPRAASPSPSPPPAASVTMRVGCPSCGALNEFSAAPGAQVGIACGACGQQFQASAGAPASSAPAPARPPAAAVGPPVAPSGPAALLAPPAASAAPPAATPAAPQTSARSPSPAPGGGSGGHGGGKLCKLGCGRPTKDGFSTCCRRCGSTKGDGSHDSECALGAVMLDRGNDRSQSPLVRAGQQLVQSPAPHGHHHGGHGGRSHSPAPEHSRRAMCKFHCGRQVKVGQMKGKPFDTCCRECAVSKGSGGHDPDCDGR